MEAQNVRLGQPTGAGVPAQHEASPHTPRVEAAAARASRAADAVAARKLLLDTSMLSLAMVASTVSGSAVGSPPPKLGTLVVFSLLTLALLAYNGLYRRRLAPQFLDALRAIVAATAVAAISVTFIRMLDADDPYAALDAVRIWLFSAVFLATARGGVQLVSRYRKRHRITAEPTLIVGAGSIGHLIARRLHERPEFGLSPAAFFDHEPLHAEDSMLPIIGQGGEGAEDPASFADQLESAVRELSIQHVIVSFSLSSHEVELALVRRCQDLGISVSLVPRLFEGIPDQTALERIGGLPLVSLHPFDRRAHRYADRGRVRSSARTRSAN